MPQSALFTGIIPPVSTIFTADGQFDKQGTAALIDDLIKAGVDGLFFLGSGGEFSQLGAEERKTIAQFAIDHVDRRVPVLIGTGGTNARETIELSQHAQQAGADGIVVINPYYWKVSEANLIRYFEQVADSVTLPVMLYNFPALTGQDLTLALVKTLADSRSNIVGIKDTIDSVAHLRSMIHTVKGAHPHFTVLCGYDDHLFNTLLLGGDGAISASGNFAPQVSVNLLKAWRDNDVAKAAEYHQTLLQIPQMYQLDTPFVNVIKEAIVLCGRPISTHVLPPASPLDAPRKAQLKTLLQQLKLC
ncbi:2-keto-3-deoxygluconate aldolase [Enterobacter cloacae complex sp. IR53043]|uniref:2-keto-3-deoxygluconate aldolase n=1 Tax=Enterobacter cloacae complex TaxID=354276 RepID=UPI000735436C|nr:MULTISPECIES: 2-keto-3-deoxygluconate aldolase [Enterobacter cloacae complex]AXQ35370.1 dihydrodipicolinate synthase family protein [Enterobacter hormaechei]EHN8935373.1 2-keto-3-deoxygluconate aldolase [Enterobacter hormaechei]EKS6505855.1 2-keto-3-deoxygluconate aldolase [Enterobacter hormaechei]EKX4734978.1 2-keto-3-deoxygluconate aldolase [Enterobacter hormaechei]ELC6427172.1 2-keto-3-deoxygluconate aldolase [Enterobacter hormaechei]